jgi:hypothetical protein
VGYLPTSSHELLHHRGINRPVLCADNGSPVVLHPPEQTNMPIEIHDKGLEEVGDRLLDGGGTCKHFGHSMLESLPTIGTPLFCYIPDDAEDRMHRAVTGWKWDKRDLDPPDLPR